VADSPFDALAGPAQTIGRYFSILSVVPSALLVTFFLVLDNSGAWSGRPDFDRGFAALGDGGFSKVGQIVLASLLIGLVLQPLQYMLVQLAEGYWGTSKLATALMRRRISHHRRIRKTLRASRDNSEEAMDNAGTRAENLSSVVVAEQAQLDLLHYQEAERALLSYPQMPNDVRPTRLGNVLRRYESEAGAPYGLGLPTIAPHLALIAPKDHMDLVNDQRTQMDLAVRLTVISVIACLLSIVFLWRDGLWLLLATVPYVLAYVFYRGAVVVAADYGVALSTVVDLDRFGLYDKMHLPAPKTLAAERALAANVMALLRTDQSPTERARVQLTFEPAAAPPLADPSTPPPIVAGLGPTGQ
jgi:hypothetical protein